MSEEKQKRTYKVIEVPDEIPSFPRTKVAKRIINGREVPPKRREYLPMQPDKEVFKNVEDIKDKMLRVIAQNHFLDLKTALLGGLHYEEYEIAIANDLDKDKELLFLIEKQKAKSLNTVVKTALKNGKTNDAFKLLALNDEDRAKLNSRVEVKSDKKKDNTITIIHKEKK